MADVFCCSQDSACIDNAIADVVADWTSYTQLFLSDLDSAVTEYTVSLGQLFDINQNLNNPDFVLTMAPSTTDQQEAIARVMAGISSLVKEVQATASSQISVEAGATFSGDLANILANVRLTFNASVAGAQIDFSSVVLAANGELSVLGEGTVVLGAVTADVTSMVTISRGQVTIQSNAQLGELVLSAGGSVNWEDGTFDCEGFTALKDSIFNVKVDVSGEPTSVPNLGVIKNIQQNATLVFTISKDFWESQTGKEILLATYDSLAVETYDGMVKIVDELGNQLLKASISTSNTRRRLAGDHAEARLQGNTLSIIASHDSAAPTQSPQAVLIALLLLLVLSF